VGARRAVVLTTTTYFEHKSAPMTENSPLDPDPSTDPYTLTKRAAFVDAMARAERGQEVCVVVCGGAYGPSPLPERSMVAPSFNQRICSALLGQAGEFLEFPVPWVMAADVARVAVAAIDRGRRGERYLAFGRIEDVGSIPFLCNTALEVAGSERRVGSVSGDRLDDVEVQERYGPSLIALAKRTFPEPFFVNDLTVERLDYHPVTLADGLGETLPWLSEHGFLPGVELRR
jgi:nucleoside-diphosphate-sugar epimerase